MPNTFPSNNAGSSSSAAAATSVTTSLRGTNTTAERRVNLQTSFEDSAPHRIAFGNRYYWLTRLLNVTAYTALVSLTGPGVVSWMTLWREGASTANDFSFRVVIDGVVALEIDPGWTTTGDDTDGYSVVGDFNTSNGDQIFDQINKDDVGYLLTESSLLNPWGSPFR